jgi:hypothetical protein
MAQAMTGGQAPPQPQPVRLCLSIANRPGSGRRIAGGVAATAA